jgi:hypothetical protein
MHGSAGCFGFEIGLEMGFFYFERICFATRSLGGMNMDDVLLLVFFFVH